MKRSMAWFFSAVLLGAPMVSSAVVFEWTGIGNGWKNQAAPTSASGEDLIFGNTVVQDIVLPGGAAPVYNSLSFQHDDDYFFAPTSPLTLTLAGGITFPGNGSSHGTATFNSNVTLSLSQSQPWDAGTNLIVVSGKVTGTGPLTLRMSSDVNGNAGFFNFNNPSGVNDYTGGTIIDMVGSGTNGVGGVAFWNNTPFGTGPVTITNGAWFSSHNTLAPVTNNFTLTSSSTNPWSLRNWDAPLTLSGNITLAGNASIAPRFAYTGLPASNNTGEYPMPGPLTRLPTTITGTVSGAYSMSVLGQGILILNPTAQNTYTGGTTINNGALVFGTALGIPTTGSITVNNSGYVGFGDVTPGNFTTQFLAAINKGSGGSLGVDTLPGNPTVTLVNNIDLSATGANFTNSNIRLGTSTSAILTGAITPQGTNYQFGGGGGSLYVMSGLGDTAGNSTTAVRALNNNDNSNRFVPLKLYLQGTNTYTGGTAATYGLIIFDGATSIPTTGSLTAATTNVTTPSLGVGGSYIGYTDSVGITPAAFLAKFNAANTWGVVGFDTHAGNPTVTINGVNLTGFNDGVYLGTASSAMLTGTLTPSTLSNANNAANTLRFTAGNGGTLTVGSNLTGAVGVVVGTPAPVPALSDGTVLLTGTNTYTGGTTLIPNGGITLGLGSSGALGTGSLQVAVSTGFLGQAGLKTTASGLVIPNNIVFQTSDYTSNSPATLALTGSNSFTLAGNISSGPLVANNGAPAGIFLYNASPLNVTLSGNNSGYYGDIDVVNGTLTLASNTAAGGGSLRFDSSAANVVFSSAATSAVLNGINGKAGTLGLPGSSNLTINLDNSALQNSGNEFGGTISEAAGGASITISSANSNSQLLYLYGHNSYSGGTTITGYGALGLGQNDSAGTGLITINATQGGLALNTGVTLTNPIQFTSGGLAGLGTFNPSSINGDSSATRTLTVGTSQIVLPGIPGNKRDIPGKLTIATNVAFATGGKFQLNLQDPASLEGHGILAIGGNLDLTSISTAGFILELTSLDATGHQGFASTIVWGQTYTNIAFADLTGGTGVITGFNATKFSVDATNFQGGAIPSSAFTVSADATHLYLSFTAVPEPSTWVLLGTGLGLLALRGWRRRR